VQVQGPPTLDNGEEKTIHPEKLFPGIGVK
jgi:hypothetical protein